MNIAEEITELKNTVEEILRDARVDYEMPSSEMNPPHDGEDHYSAALLAVVNALDELSFSAAEQEAVTVNETIDERDEWIDPDNAHEHVWVPASVTRALWNAGKITAAQGLDLFELFDLVEAMCDEEPARGSGTIPLALGDFVHTDDPGSLTAWIESIRETVRS